MEDATAVGSGRASSEEFAGSEIRGVTDDSSPAAAHGHRGFCLGKVEGCCCLVSCAALCFCNRAGQCRTGFQPTPLRTSPAWQVSQPRSVALSSSRSYATPLPSSLQACRWLGERQHTPTARTLTAENIHVLHCWERLDAWSATRPLRRRRPPVCSLAARALRRPSPLSRAFGAAGPRLRIRPACGLHQGSFPDWFPGTRRTMATAVCLLTAGAKHLHPGGYTLALGVL